MASEQFTKLFTVEEANQLIPRLELIVRSLQEQAHVVRARVGELADSADTPPDIEQLSRTDPQVGDAIREISENAQMIEELGCFLKDIDLGLVDFPTEIGGEVVYLCWQYGEPQLVAWHPVGQGFSSRQPLAGTRKFFLN